MDPVSKGSGLDLDRLPMLNISKITNITPAMSSRVSIFVPNQCLNSTFPYGKI